VTVCKQPQEAVEVAARLRPAIITLDVVMLPLNGWEVLSALKGDPRTDKIPVVMVTVVDQKATGTLLGADEYIVKPVDKAILLEAVGRCLNRSSARGAGQTVLVVEDDTATREFIVDLLIREGYQVSHAADGAQARVRMRTLIPDLVILDLILPEIGGFALLDEWRKDTSTADLPIVVLSNKELTEKERDYLRSTTGAFLSKHGDWREELVRQIQQAAQLAMEMQ
jgi:CheY-like chemotaxis protein